MFSSKTTPVVKKHTQKNTGSLGLAQSCCQIQVKYRLYVKFLKIRDRDLLKTLKRYCNKQKKLIRNAKASFFGDIFSKCENKADATWEKFNTLVNRPCKRKPIAKICLDNEEWSGCCLANGFNKVLLTSTEAILTVVL